MRCAVHGSAIFPNPRYIYRPAGLNWSFDLTTLTGCLSAPITFDTDCIHSMVASTELKQNPYLADPDVQLMLRVKGGDDDAFTRLMNSWQDRLISIYFHLLPDRQSAEDLVQEAFMRIYRSRRGYEPNAKFSTWLFRIAQNIASNSRRSAGRRKEVPLSPQDSGPLGKSPAERLLTEKSGLMPQRQLDKREMQDLVQVALQTLNENQKMAVLLHKFEDMSYADIAEAMELSPAAVKSLLSRARETLRNKLEQYVK